MNGPLKDLLVVDLTRVLVGPYCTMILSDLGARVIKIEAPEIGDDSRKFGPFVKDYSAYFMSLNRGKESIALNLKNEDDKKIFEKILAKADILVENFKPGTLEKWGFGWKQVSKKYPKLIYASASGFGQTGPLKELPAYDMVVQGMGGLMSVTGQPNSEPTRVGTSIGDITAGLFTAIGINAALYDRQKTGKGMYIDVSMLDCQIAILENAIARYLSKNEILQLRIAETEKYPHVTYFFNGGKEESFLGEERILCPSPKVATYDLKPEMSAKEVTQNVITEIKKNKFGFICLNFANPDMVGHTGNLKAAVEACESVDKSLGKIVDVANLNDYVTIIIADHGNCEIMINSDGTENTSHTVNPVPIIIVNSNSNKINNGILADIAPTVLDIMGVQKPDEMTGKSLIN